MATLAQRSSAPEGTRFFTIMALVMAGVIVAGFSLNLAMGRSSFGMPLAFHVHGLIFMGWLALYLAQGFTIATGQIALHRQLGRIAYGLIPRGCWRSARLPGGPCGCSVMPGGTGG